MTLGASQPGSQRSGRPDQRWSQHGAADFTNSANCRFQLTEQQATHPPRNDTSSTALTVRHSASPLTDSGRIQIGPHDQNRASWGKANYAPFPFKTRSKQDTTANGPTMWLFWPLPLQMAGSANVRPPPFCWSVLCSLHVSRSAAAVSVRCPCCRRPCVPRCPFVGSSPLMTVCVSCSLPPLKCGHGVLPAIADRVYPLLLAVCCSFADRVLLVARHLDAVPL